MRARERAPEARDAKAERIERVFEQQVVLVAIAPAAVAHHLLLQRLHIEANRPPYQRVQVFKRDGFGMPDMDGG